MIVRIVKMEFRVEEIETFKAVFEASKANIRTFPGVLYLELDRRGFGKLSSFPAF